MRTIALLLFFYSACVNAIYVCDSGNNDNDGLTAQTPKQTIVLNEYYGSQLHLCRGGTFNIKSMSGNGKVDSYGIGDNPIINGDVLFMSPSFGNNGIEFENVTFGGNWFIWAGSSLVYIHDVFIKKSLTLVQAKNARVENSKAQTLITECENCIIKNNEISTLKFGIESGRYQNFFGVKNTSILDNKIDSFLANSLSMTKYENITFKNNVINSVNCNYCNTWNIDSNIFNGLASFSSSTGGMVKDNLFNKGLNPPTNSTLKRNLIRN